MIKISRINVEGFEPAIRGMRNSHMSWDKSDSDFPDHGYYFEVGDADMELMLKLAKLGGSHAKFRRMIILWCDILAPLYWWKEFDTYKVGTVANSTSTMHSIADHKFTRDDFSCEHMFEAETSGIPDHEEQITGIVLNTIISSLNYARDEYIFAKEEGFEKQAKAYWWQMIQLLPSSYNQLRTVMVSYETLAHMHNDRKNHRLDEWRDFDRQLYYLPCHEIITGDDGI